jgi:hypothetical protein
MKHLVSILLLFLMAACAAQRPATGDPNSPVTSPTQNNMPTREPALNPLAPQPGDGSLTRGNVFITEASLVIRESFPPQVSVSIKGELPTPCHQLRAEINEPDTDNKIVMDVYSVVNPDLVCIQVVEPFDESIDLGTYPSGHYTVWVNGEMIGEFDT